MSKNKNNNANRTEFADEMDVNSKSENNNKSNNCK